MNKGILYLLPCYLGENSSKDIFSAQTKNIVETLTHFVVENEKSARKFLKFIFPEVKQPELQISILDKSTDNFYINEIAKPLLEGENVGYLSEAGLPCIADPGNVLVQFAHKNSIKIVPINGPSSIILALISSGLNGQNFTFNGYLPIDKSEKTKQLKFLESLSSKNNSAQIFMETPYRNNTLLEDIVKVCNPNTMLCIATNITLEDEFIQTKTIQQWKMKLPDLHKKPTIFIIQSGY